MKKVLRFIAVSTIIMLVSLFQITIANATEYGLIYFTDQYGREMSSYWKLDDTTGILTIYGEGPIPDYTNGEAPPYTGNVNGLYLGPLVKTVIVEDGITRIGNFAFATISGNYTTPNVNAIYLAESVREIGESAFNRESIKTVVIYSENISFEANAITPEATVYGYAGSCVEDYANSNGNVFIALCREHTIQIVDSVEPGCETQGFSGNKVCSVCGVTIEQGEILDALGHNYETVNAVVPSCTEDGYSGDVCCSRCGDIKEEGEVIPANGHLFGGWQVTKMPTCYSLGEKIRFCENCDVYEVADVSMQDHNWDENYTVDVEATCIEEGQESIHCTVCGAIKEGSQQVIEKTDHTYGDWIIIEEPTCTVEGTKKKQCEVCEDTITETIPATGHIWNEEYTVDRAATTTEEGSQSIHCSVCDEIKEGSEQVIPKLKSGWVKENETWYYINDTGEYAKGWLKSGGVWYYLDPSTGAMITGWKQVGGTWYYFKSGGSMVTGWQKIDGTWYYFKSGGAMVKGWQKIDNKWYYFKSSGAMAANEWCEGYWLNKDGSWTYKPIGSWHQNAKGWWFGDTSGWYAKNTTIKIDNKNYTFDASGYWVK